MPLSIVSDPIDNTLSKDPINYTIATGVSYVPLDALDLIIPTGGDGAGDSFDYTINGITNTFALPARNPGDTDLQYANAIATALANESLLFQLTTITVVDALHINIQAQAGLTISGAWVVGGTGGWYLSYPTAIPADGTMVAVWVVMGADNTPLLKVHDNPILLPMAENVAVEISNILQANLLQANWLPDIPTCNQTTITENLITRKNYAIKYGNWQFGELLDLTQSTPKNVIFGGTGGWLDHITPHKPLLTATGELNKFLTHQPRKKLITHLQPEFLTHFHHEPAITDIQVHVIAYNGDGSILADFYPTNLTYTVQYGHTYVIPVGIAATNVCVATPTAVYYKVEVVNAGNLTPISEQFTYIITPHTKNTRYYVFLNSLSGIDTIATNTRVLMGLENNREIATRGYPNDPNPSEFGTMFTYNPDLSRSYELSTQLYSRCDVQWLQELLLQNAWAAELKYCQPCCGCPDDTAECYYIPIIVDNTMKIPISENGDVRVDWAYREATIHHSYPMDICPDDTEIIECNPTMEFLGYIDGVDEFENFYRTYTYRKTPNSCDVDATIIALTAYCTIVGTEVVPGSVDYTITIFDPATLFVMRTYECCTGTPIYATNSGCESALPIDVEYDNITGIAITAGGVAPLTYYSSNGITQTPILIGDTLAPGNYVISVVDDDGCIGSETITIV